MAEAAAAARTAMIVGKSVTTNDSVQYTFCSFAQSQSSLTPAIAAAFVSFASAALPSAMHTDLHEVLSVSARRARTSSDHFRSSGSFDIV